MSTLVMNHDDFCSHFSITQSMETTTARPFPPPLFSFPHHQRWSCCLVWSNLTFCREMAPFPLFAWKYIAICVFMQWCGRIAIWMWKGGKNWEHKHQKDVEYMLNYYIVHILLWSLQFTPLIHLHPYLLYLNKWNIWAY